MQIQILAYVSPHKTLECTFHEDKKNFVKIKTSQDISVWSANTAL